MMNAISKKQLYRTVLATAAFSLAGCATHDPRDPLEPLNRVVYRFNDTVDKAVTKPVAQGYRAVLPKPVRNSVSNFFSNIDDLFVTGNDLLQFKFKAAASDFSRLLTNSTIGIGGLFDAAGHFGLEKHDEDLGQTLGYWGVGNGPFLMVPLYGPSTVRDAVGDSVQTYLDPVWNLHDVPVRNSLAGLRFVNTRANLLDAEKVLDTAALDPYTFLRDAYLQQRRSLIYDGNPPRDDQGDAQDSVDVPKAATAPATPAEPVAVGVTPPDSAPAATPAKDADAAAAESSQGGGFSALLSLLRGRGDVAAQE